MSEATLTTLIEIELDDEMGTYKTKSMLEIGEQFKADGTDVPRDILLGMIYELDLMSSRVMKKSKITDEELAEYIADRRYVNEQCSDDTNVLKTKDPQDSVIDNLFEDEDNTDM